MKGLGGWTLTAVKIYCEVMVVMVLLMKWKGINESLGTITKIKKYSTY